MDYAAVFLYSDSECESIIEDIKSEVSQYDDIRSEVFEDDESLYSDL